jgi:hypothetical protein
MQISIIKQKFYGTMAKNLFDEIDLTLLESDDDLPFTTPVRLPAAKPSEKKRRIAPTFLGSSSNLFPDIKTTNDKCMFCETKGVTTIFGKYPVCNICAPHTMGVALDHPKIKLITSLRKEVKEFENIKKQFVGRNVITSEIDRRIREIERVIISLVDYKIDLTHLTTL